MDLTKDMDESAYLLQKEIVGKYLLNMVKEWERLDIDPRVVLIGLEIARNGARKSL